MKTVFVSRLVFTYQQSSFSSFYLVSFAGVLSALGLALADVVHEMQEPSGKVINSDNWSNITDRLKHLSTCGIEELSKQGYARFVTCRSQLNLYFHFLVVNQLL